MRRIYAIGNNGSIYAARVTTKNIDDLVNAYTLAEDNTRMLLLSWIGKGKITVDEAIAYHSHIINAALSRAGMIRYHAILAHGTPEWVWQAIDIVGG